MHYALCTVPGSEFLPQVVVEAPLGLARHHAVVALEAGVITGNQPEKANSLHSAVDIL